MAAAARLILAYRNGADKLNSKIRWGIAGFRACRQAPEACRLNTLAGDQDRALPLFE